MRVLVLALALAVAPLGVSAAQAPGGRPSERSQASAVQAANCGLHLTPIIASQGRAKVQIPVHDGRHGAMDYPCAPPPPPPAEEPLPPPPAEEEPPPVGGTMIDGSVFDGTLGTPLANWLIDLTGTVVASVRTDASGNYSFTGLPDGTYLVCQVVPVGWVATFPKSGPVCPTGYGHSFTLEGGTSASFVNFKATQQ